MNNQNKIKSIVIQIPYKGPGNIIKQQEVRFDIFKEANKYKAVPLLNGDELRVANLPDELFLQLKMVKQLAKEARGMEIFM